MNTKQDNTAAETDYQRFQSYAAIQNTPISAACLFADLEHKANDGVISYKLAAHWIAFESPGRRARVLNVAKTKDSAFARFVLAEVPFPRHWF